MLTDALACATIPATDLDRARRFYGEQLGLTEVALGGGSGGLYYQAGQGTMIQVYERPATGAAEHTVATFLVENLEEVMSRLQSRGVSFEEYDMPGLKTENGIFTGQNGFKVSWVKDPDGNILGLEQLPST